MPGAKFGEWRSVTEPAKVSWVTFAKDMGNKLYFLLAVNIQIASINDIKKPNKLKYIRK